MLPTDSGIVNWDNELHSANAWEPMDEIEVPIDTLVRLELALLLIHVHIVRCTTVRLRGKRNMGYGWGTMEG